MGVFAARQSRQGWLSRCVGGPFRFSWRRRAAADGLAMLPRCVSGEAVCPAGADGRSGDGQSGAPEIAIEELLGGSGGRGVVDEGAVLEGELRAEFSG